MRTPRTVVTATALAAAFALGACGGGGDDTAAAADTAGASTATTVATSSSSSSSSSSTKVNANTASRSEIAAAIEAAGVSNANRWAGEVLEYRPYDTSDPDLGHLREELAKYNPGDDVIDQIVSVLEP